jgi:hypothetical protein
VFPEATIQTYVVHLLRHSLDFVSYKDRKAVAAALKDIYRAVDAAAGEAALDAFDIGLWGRRYPAIGQSWRRAWSEAVPFPAERSPWNLLQQGRAQRSLHPHGIGLRLQPERRPRRLEASRINAMHPDRLLRAGQPWAQSSHPVLSMPLHDCLGAGHDGVGCR